MRERTEPAMRRLAARRPGTVDAILYAVSAAFALVIVATAAIPQYREWGRMAVVPYALAAAVAAAIAGRATGPRARTWLAIAVLIAAALVPLAVETVRRADTGMGFHAQSEVIVTEEAAKALMAGRNPYATTYLHGPLAARPIGTKTHFPYLPGMIAFGMPRALDGRSPFADARVWFAAVTLGAAALALLPRRRSLPNEDARRLAFQVLAVLPTGALLLATGGDDVPVLALMLLSLVLLNDDRPIGSGLALGAALAMKQTAWLLIPFVLMAAPAGRARRRLAGAMLAVAFPVIVPFVLWNPAAFVEDAIRFPLGLGAERSAAGTPTLGSSLISAFPGAKIALTALFAAVVLGAVLVLLVRRPPSTAAGAARAAGIVFAVALVLAPSARSGYLVYPIDLLVWAWVLGSRRPSRSVHSDAEEVPA